MRRAGIAIASIVVLLVLAVIIQFCVAYLRTPALVAEAERITPMPLSPSDFQDARLQWLLTVDDPNFFHHHGVDVGPSAAGYTTITQGVVKRLFFEHFEPGFLRWKKIRQIIIALAFDRRLPKKEQLRLFVNTVPLGMKDGQEIRGFAQGAQAFFSKDFGELSDDQYLSLVAAMTAPGKYAPNRHPAENQERVKRIRRLLAGACSRTGIGDVELATCATHQQPGDQ